MDLAFAENKHTKISISANSKLFPTFSLFMVTRLGIKEHLTNVCKDTCGREGEN